MALYSVISGSCATAPVSHVIRSDGDCRVRVLCVLGKLE